MESQMNMDAIRINMRNIMLSMITASTAGTEGMIIAGTVGMTTVGTEGMTTIITETLRNFS